MGAKQSSWQVKYIPLNCRPMPCDSSPTSPKLLLVKVLGRPEMNHIPQDIQPLTRSCSQNIHVVSTAKFLVKGNSQDGGGCIDSNVTDCFSWPLQYCFFSILNSCGNPLQTLFFRQDRLINCIWKAEILTSTVLKYNTFGSPNL